MRLPKTDRPARAGALLIALATACVVSGCAAPGLGQAPATLSSAGHGPQSAEKVQRQCEEHRGVIASYVGEMAKWQVASEKEVAAPAPTLSRALERMFGSSE